MTAARRRRVQLTDLCEYLAGQDKSCLHPATHTVLSANAKLDADSHRVCRNHIGHATEALFNEQDGPVQVVPDFALEGVHFRGDS